MNNLQFFNCKLNSVSLSRNRRAHAYYSMWNERKNKNLLCEEWLDFEKFINDIGERPSKDHKLYRKNIKLKFSKDNFQWKLIFTKLPNETKKQVLIRRRKEKPEIYKNAELKKHFGITIEQYNELLKIQNFVCAICGEKEKVKHHVTGSIKSLAVDHCHETGKIRGLLCQRCNRVLGKVKDNVVILDKMKEYLK